jgi:outer membrane protein OmpA-like peptidoglycan-associated protein/tetratricopeptide (TPR) repeat protein
MKNLYIAISFMIVSTSLIAQNKNTKKADKLYSQFAYVPAAEEYLKLSNNGKGDPYVYKQLAESYYNMFNTTEAATWYGRATETPQDAETYYKYAQMLKANGKYEEANKQMQQFASKAPNDQRAKAFKENPNYLPKLLAKDKQYDVKSLDINSDKSDFGAVLNNNTLYFSSARNKAKKTYKWNGEPFLDMYQAAYNTDGTFSAATEISEINSQYHDGPATLSKDGNTMYFASESYLEKSYEKDKLTKDKKSQVNLFKATKTGNTWGNITPLPFNSKEYSTGNPSLSQDGKTLYFSSNMPGSLGGNDIWTTTVNQDGSYGTPENMGNKVNTEGNESFPSISDDNKTLYFASSGRQGLGGLDVFQIDMAKGKTSGEASNLGKPVNSEKDDFAFTMNQEKNIGFLSSNRNVQDDIYLVKPVCALNVQTIVTNAKTGAILSDAKVTILDDKKNIIATEMSNSKGEVNYKVECEKAYTIQASKDGFESNTFLVASVNKPMQTKVDAPLQPIDVIVTETEIILKPIYFEYDKSNITQEGAFELDKLVQVMKNNEKLVIMSKSHTDNRGSDLYNMTLSDKRAKATVAYVISKGIEQSRISGKGFGESEPKVDCKETCTEEQYAQNRRSEFLIVK